MNRELGVWTYEAGVPPRTRVCGGPLGVAPRRLESGRVAPRVAPKAS
jgi:hypothetical protein